jgi:hypothetical protein
MMKVLRQLTLFAALIVGFSLTATAQKPDDKKNPPPKENVPKISPQPKKPDKPKDDKKNDDRRRPGMAMTISSNEEESV